MSLFYVTAEVLPPRVLGGRDVVVLAAVGELDFIAAPQLEGQLEGHARAAGGLLLDLSMVTFIDSTAIGVLVAAVTERARHPSGVLAIACGEENRRVRRILEIAGVCEVLRLHPSREAALAVLAADSI